MPGGTLPDVTADGRGPLRNPWRETFVLGLDGVDAFGIVFYAQYCYWYQRTLESLFAAAGHTLREIIDGGLGFPVVRFEIDYRSPLRLSDRVHTDLELVRVGRRSLKFEASFSNDDGAVTAVARAVQVATRKDFLPAEVPEWLRDLATAPAPTDA